VVEGGLTISYLIAFLACFLTGRLGLTTCYDVRFPEMYMGLVELGPVRLWLAVPQGLPIGTFFYGKSDYRIPSSLFIVLLAFVTHVCFV
jgi:hypothetical protein